MQNIQGIRSWGVRLLLAVSLIVPLLIGGVGVAAAEPSGNGTVYTLTNAASGNAVAVFNRAADGTLSAAGTFATGGLGTSAGLGSQGALVLSADHSWLFAVNAGSNDISVFAVHSTGLVWVDKVASGGIDPISLTVHGNLLYVLNAGGGGNITGFTIGSDGKLTPLANSTRPLSGSSAGPAQISFSPNGEVLAVTEKATSLIDTYQVNDNGLASGPATHASSGKTPFGFAFDQSGALIVAEAAGGPAGTSAVSSYRVSDDHFAVVSASVPDTQLAACWLVVTGKGQFAYTANAASGSISSYSVSPNDSLSLLNSKAGLTGSGSHPIDMALSNDSHYLYQLASGAQAIDAFIVQPDGSLSSIGNVGGLPASVVGLAAW